MCCVCVLCVCVCYVCVCYVCVLCVCVSQKGRSQKVLIRVGNYRWGINRIVATVLDITLGRVIIMKHTDCYDGQYTPTNILLAILELISSTIFAIVVNKTHTKFKFPQFTGRTTVPSWLRQVFSWDQQSSASWSDLLAHSLPSSSSHSPPLPPPPFSSSSAPWRC